MEVMIGKINSVRIGHGGYQDAMIGITFDLGGKGWGIGDHWGAWSIERSDYCEWTEEDRIDQLGKIFMRINELLKKSKVDDVNKLKNIPVEVTIEGNTLKSWRILEEVL